VEVSGIHDPTSSNNGERRLLEKVAQIHDGRARGTRPLPGIAAVFVIRTHMVLTQHVPLG
jgi:hypothetical protein